MTEPGSRITEAAAILRSGGVIVYPTETVYGLGCDPWNRDAFNKILRLKGRNAAKAMILLADSLSMVESALGKLGGIAACIAARFWPGPLTMVLPSAPGMPSYLCGPSGGVAFRVTTHPDAAALISAFGRPLISTSANPSGQLPAATAGEAVRLFGAGVDMVVDASFPPGGIPSTVIDLTGERPVLLREGAVLFSRVLEALES